MNKSLASVIPRGENLSIIYPLFISCVFNIETDKCFVNDFFLLERGCLFYNAFPLIDGRLSGGGGGGGC